MLGVGGDEHRLALDEVDLLVFDLERAGALEDDVDLVVLVRLLAVGLGRDEDVDADLEPVGGVDDLVAAVPSFSRRFAASTSKRCCWIPPIRRRLPDAGMIVSP